MIAQRLKLSESTVSRALNDYQDIALETKELVRKTAAELGYVPNMHARRLASGKADTIAFVMPRTDGQLNAAFLGELMTGMAEALTARGWDLSVLVPRNLDEELAMYQYFAYAPCKRFDHFADPHQRYPVSVPKGAWNPFCRTWSFS